jgi:hypothetical protein
MTRSLLPRVKFFGKANRSTKGDTFGGKMGGKEEDESESSVVVREKAWLWLGAWANNANVQMCYLVQWECGGFRNKNH